MSTSTDSVCGSGDPGGTLRNGDVEGGYLEQMQDLNCSASILVAKPTLISENSISDSTVQKGQSRVDEGDEAHCSSRVDYNDEKSRVMTPFQRDTFFASLVPNEAQLPDELVEAAKRLAKRLYHLDGFKAGDVSFELCKSTKFSDLVAEKFMDHFDFKDMVLHSALRTFLTRFTLPGSVSETDPLRYEQALTNRELLIYMFCNRYVNCNPKVFDTCDACYVIVCSMMLLNTDLHGMMPHHQHHNRTLIASKTHHKKMSFSDFKRNLQSTDWGPVFNNDLLKSIYNSIKHEPLTTLDPFSETFDNGASVAYKKGKVERKVANGHSRSTISCLSLRSNTTKKHYNEEVKWTAENNSIYKEPLRNPESAFITDHRESANCPIVCSGWLMRKCICEDGGKKTSRMKRGWVRLFTKLENLHMWFYRSENTNASAIPVECVQIHHSLARVMGQHKRRLNVFTLRLATNCLTVNNMRKMCICRLQGAEYIFQARDVNDMNNWVLMINLAAALFSSPPFAPPVSSLMTTAMSDTVQTRSVFPINEVVQNGDEVDCYPLRKVEEGVFLPSSSRSVAGPLQQRQWYNKQVSELREKLAELKTFNDCVHTGGENEDLITGLLSTCGKRHDNFAQLIEQEISRNLDYIKCIDEFLTRTHGPASDKKSDTAIRTTSDHNRPSIIYSSNHNSTLCTLREDCNSSSISIESPFGCDESACGRLELCGEVRGSPMLELAKCPSPSTILKRDAVVVADGTHDGSSDR